MGGGYYDRDDDYVVPSNNVSNNSGNDYSNKADTLIGQNTQLAFSMDPRRWKEQKLICNGGDPIVFALDVTGSMGDWSKIIYDKLPMFYGQLMIQKYLKNPSISFCAIGDHTSDDVPLQTSEFGQGKGIDQLLSKMFLEGGGGGNQHESYELAAFFYAEHCGLVNHDYPFFFVTGDEGYWDLISPKVLQAGLGSEIGKEVKALDVWKKLMTQYNVFHIKKSFWDTDYEPDIITQWQATLGSERVLEISNPKACIDVILGAIAITSGTRTLDLYIKDMVDRGQTKERIDEVSNALKQYSIKIQTKTIKPIKGLGAGSSKSTDSSLVGVSNKTFPELKEATEKMYMLQLSGDKLESYKNTLKLSNKLKGEIPTELTCPLTGDLFFDPVMTSDGSVFERKAIELWFLSKNTNPLTDKTVDSKDLVPNIVFRQLANTFLDNNKDALK